VNRWDRYFLVVQRTSSVLVLLLALGFLATLALNWLEFRRYQREFGGDADTYGGKFERTLPYSGQQIETADGELIAIMQDDGEPGERIALGGITITNPTTGKFIEVSDDTAPNVVQFELIYDQGDDGKVVGYLATVATRDQFEQGRQNLIVGALPAMTRNIVARNIRYSDLPRIRGDGSVGMLMWPEEGEAYLIAIRLGDGAIIGRTRVKLPTLKQNRLSQGTGDGYFLPGRQGVPNEAPRAAFGYVE
jgi:hypothetical protein